MQKHKEWLDFAQDDLKVAYVLMNPDHISIRAALYHAQQCSEKALKGYLVCKTNKQPPRTHDLPGLVEHCAILDSDFNSIKQDAYDVNPFSVATRYPADTQHIPFIEDALATIKQAENILHFVLHKLNL